MWFCSVTSFRVKVLGLLTLRILNPFTALLNQACHKTIPERTHGVLKFQRAISTRILAFRLALPFYAQVTSATDGAQGASLTGDTVA